MGGEWRSSKGKLGAKVMTIVAGRDLVLILLRTDPGRR